MNISIVIELRVKAEKKEDAKAALGNLVMPLMDLVEKSLLEAGEPVAIHEIRITEKVDISAVHFTLAEFKNPGRKP